MHISDYAKTFHGNQAEFAYSLGISRPYLSLLLAGKKRPSLELAIRIEHITDGAVPAASWVSSKAPSA